MKKILVTALLGLFVAAPSKAQTTINFDASCPSTIGLLEGVQFNNQFACWMGTQFPYTPKSPGGRVYGRIQDPSFNFASPVTFSGAWFSGQTWETVYFRLFLNNVLVGTSGSLTMSSTPTFLAGGYAGNVDEVQVLSSHHMNWAMDDMGYGPAAVVIPGEPPVVATPEPASLVLMLTGLAGIVGVARRRRNA